MRILALLLLSLTTSWGQAPAAPTEDAKVGIVLQQMERDEQTGDFDHWLTLWTRQKSAEMEELRPYIKARPTVHYRALRILVRGDLAVLLAGASAQSFVTMTLRQEDGRWKVQDQLWRETAPDANSVYAFVPPTPGAFARAGSHWEQIAPAMDSAFVARQGWQLKTVFDESCLYIRIESSDELPLPGSTIEKPPGGWPVFKIVTSPNGSSRSSDFVLNATVNVGDQATFDEHGKANSHRAFAAYMIRLERNDHEILSATAGLDPSPLLAVAGREYDIQIPLAALGVSNSRAATISLGDAQWPRTAILNVTVPRFPQ